MITRKPPPPASSSKKTAAWLFAAVGLLALGWSGYQTWQQYKADNPPPLPNVIAPIPADRVDAVRTGLKLVGPTVLGLSGDQQKEIDAIWKNPPRSMEEVIQYQRRTDEVMTPEQRAKFRPLRKAFQGRVIDQMLAPAGERMPPDDFQKMKEEVGKRVDERIEGPSR